MANLTKKPKVLFFIKGVQATKEDIKTGGNIPHANVQYRNALEINAKDPLEPCDGVYGAVPKSYSKLPSAEKAIEAYVKAIESAKKDSGDKEAPKPTKKASELPDLSEASSKKKGKGK